MEDRMSNARTTDPDTEKEIDLLRQAIFKQLEVIDFQDARIRHAIAAESQNILRALFLLVFYIYILLLLVIVPLQVFRFAYSDLEPLLVAMAPLLIFFAYS